MLLGVINLLVLVPWRRHNRKEQRWRGPLIHKVWIERDVIHCNGTNVLNETKCSTHCTGQRKIYLCAKSLLKKDIKWVQGRWRGGGHCIFFRFVNCSKGPAACVASFAILPCICKCVLKNFFLLKIFPKINLLKKLLTKLQNNIQDFGKCYTSQALSAYGL